MTDAIQSAPGRRTAFARRLWSDYRVWLATAAILILVTVFDPAQGMASLHFAAQALLETGP